jgi:hypothetical protein
MADKGLKSNVVGLFGGTMLGISSVAPAYALTATLGILAASVGANTPVVIIAGFLPMFFAAYAYREFNNMPDAGTSFTWTSKAFGPYIGWRGGCAAVLATIIVPCNMTPGDRMAPIVRQRRQHWRDRAGADLGPWADLGRFGLHGDPAGISAGVLPRRDDHPRVGARAHGQAGTPAEVMT